MIQHPPSPHDAPSPDAETGTSPSAFSGAVFLLPERQVLLQRKDMIAGLANAGKISLFGGGAEPGEDRDRCLRREIQEELGFAIDWRTTQFRFDFLKQEPGHAPILCSIFISHDLYSKPLHELTCSEGTPVIVDAISPARQDLTEACRYVLDRLKIW